VGDEPESAAGDEPESVVEGEPESAAGGEPESAAGGEPESRAGGEPESAAGGKPESGVGDVAASDPPLAPLASGCVPESVALEAPESTVPSGAPLSSLPPFWFDSESGAHAFERTKPKISIGPRRKDENRMGQP
jgi:hypothetical protein